MGKNKSKKNNSKNKSLVKEMSSRLYLVYSENRQGGGVCEGDEDSEWPNREDTIVDVSFKALYRNPPDNIMFYTSYEVTEDIYKASVLHMALIRYSDGDTFGRTCGLWHVIDFYHTFEEAERSIKDAKNGTGYKPWEGYFSSYETDDVEILDVFDKQMEKPVKLAGFSQLWRFQSSNLPLFTYCGELAPGKI